MKNNLLPVFNNFSSEANPWCFPAYVKNQNDAIEWFKWGWKNKVKIFSWPTLPEEILIKNDDSFNRWKKLICFEI